MRVSMTISMTPYKYRDSALSSSVQLATHDIYQQLTAILVLKNTIKCLLNKHAFLQVLQETEVSHQHHHTSTVDSLTALDR